MTTILYFFWDGFGDSGTPQSAAIADCYYPGRAEYSDDPRGFPVDSDDPRGVPDQC